MDSLLSLCVLPFFIFMMSILELGRLLSLLLEWWRKAGIHWLYSSSCQRFVNPGTGSIHVFIHSWCVSHSIWSGNNSVVVSKRDANLGKSWRCIFQTNFDSLRRAFSVRIYNLWLQRSFEWMCCYFQAWFSYQLLRIGIRGRFWSQSYVHVALFVSCLKNQFKISNLQTENEDYSGFEFVIETELLKNFTVNWDQNIKNRKLDCNGIARHEIELAAFYLANYDCEYS